ncbi:2-polyprenyl-6-methoxyphenol hydroxylase-like FAD-dependent oxidoreductase [Streptosporangium album]|uniref:2-polyprenyl-6-methoxyphenol hydroxylase-like FAD-dependent oxidoreductase n=1 Tax=Streptosporangium album TaxID=47479 RepID=A0A7W7S184_9ACTN|nr:FAD-dependent monooxygenase [Streptosporangium album]MBB4941867.1 2-polyprenyl-6-methoxyphenol hydroxylase-like FAD-dependent oxidoreductase [Streptosporangium album]
MFMQILISGASVAGPVLAYWLTRHGFSVTVVERAPALRKTGGHAVDLFRPAMNISEKMGVLPRVEERATGTNRMTLCREGARRPVRVDLSKIFSATSDRHVEIMRDDLSEIYYDATCDDVEYVFGDSITAMSPDGEVRFENAAPRHFDLVVGADGLHSNVRRLVFGDESRFSAFVGAYLGVLTLPNTSGLDGELLIHVGVGRTAGMYGARHLGDARALFLFRSERELDYHHRDVPRQKELLRGAFDGLHADVDRWLDELDRTPAFYFDSITQLRMDTWSRGRVTLVGDAGYCPGPAVGGSTSLAVVGAYVLAGELARAGGDHERAFPAYERAMAEHVRGSRAAALSAAKTLIPTSRLGVSGLAQGARLISALPAGPSRALLRLTTKSARLYNSMTVDDYPPSPTASGGRVGLAGDTGGGLGSGLGVE